MTNLITSIILGFIIGAIPFVVHITGYGSYWRYSWPIFVLFVSPILIILPIFRIKAFRKNQVSKSSCILGIIFIIIFPMLSTFAGDQIRRFCCRRNCRASEPVLEALRQYKISNGRYPKNLEEIPNFKNLQKSLEISIQQGKVHENGFSVENINDADATVYLMKDDFYCVVPIQKRVMMSITRFTIYGKSSKDKDWLYDYMIWMIGGIKK